MPMCPWCERVCNPAQMVVIEFPDDDSLEVCDACAIEDEDEKEHHRKPRSKKVKDNVRD